MAVGIAVALLHASFVRRESSSRFTQVSLELVRHCFPDATSVGRPDVRGLQRVKGANGQLLGFVLTTSPQTDDLVGYSGPNNLLVWLTPEGEVAGMELLTSGDSEAHVRALQAVPRVWTNYSRWRPQEEEPPPPVVVSGSTLTSLALAEAMQRRLAGVAVSLRFPETVTLSELLEWFPEASRLEPDVGAKGWWRVETSQGRLLGFAVRTAPQADNVRGYRGPTEGLVAVAPDRQSVRGIGIRKSYDTPEYVDRVREDPDYLAQCASFSVAEWAWLDFDEAKLEGVSGATQTSYGLAEGLRRRFAADEVSRDRRPFGVWGRFQTRDWALVLLGLGALGMSFAPGRGLKWVRRSWQVVLVGGYGLALGDLVSLALLIGWAQNGVAQELAPGLAILCALAMVAPVATRRPVYCQHLCPHGVLQDWLRNIPVRQYLMPRCWVRWLRWLPGSLLGTAFVLSLIGRAGDLAAWEPFDAWTLGTAAAFSMLIAAVGLAFSAFIPMGYCRLGCPTGALLRFLRSPGSADRWGTGDLVAVLLLAFAGFVMVGDPVWSQAERIGQDATDPGTRVGGTGFGTTWTLTTRTPVPDRVDLQQRAQAEINRIEHTFSHWHPNSITAQFNAAETTRPLVVPQEFWKLLQVAQRISQATSGAFDITVAPLARALGFGPHRPDDDRTRPITVEEARQRVGWRKLRVDPERSTIAKRHPMLELDLGALLQGYAADRLARWLREQGFAECLVDVGGELRAVGEWEVAVEDPRVPGSTIWRLTLRDAALATSGVYRGSVFSETGERRAHLLDPRNGNAVDHDTVLVAVQSSSALEADAWSTALLVMRADDARVLAEEKRIQALFLR
jgi:thiamine biosynthesis lipoprotein ApbE